MKRFCRQPFEFLEIVDDGTCFVCCPGWLPHSIGNLAENDVMAIWNSASAQMLRQSILEGTFQFCRPDQCPELSKGVLPCREEMERDVEYADIIRNKRVVLDRGPRILNPGYDKTCNLACPSCRQRQIALSGKQFSFADGLQDRLFRSNRVLEDVCRIYLTGHGDPLASRLYRGLLERDLDIKKYPKMRITLLTNGLLLTPEVWEGLSRKNVIDVVDVSLDAATSVTYGALRGGDWDSVIRNVGVLCEVRHEGRLEKVMINMTVQAANYKEMKAFVELGRRLGCTKVEFSTLANRGTYTLDEYIGLAVHDPGHPEHDAFLEELKDECFDDQLVDLGNLAPLRRAALERMERESARPVAHRLLLALIGRKSGGLQRLWWRIVGNARRLRGG